MYFYGLGYFFLFFNMFLDFFLRFLYVFFPYAVLLESSEVCSARDDLNSNAKGNAKAKAKGNAKAKATKPKPSQRPREFPKSVQEFESSETCCKQGDLNSKRLERLEDLRF